MFEVSMEEQIFFSLSNRQIETKSRLKLHLIVLLCCYLAALNWPVVRRRPRSEIKVSLPHDLIYPCKNKLIIFFHICSDKAKKAETRTKQGILLR